MRAPLKRESIVRRGWAIPTLILIHLCLVCVVPVTGDFPTNDDWAYARVTKTFLETGHIRLSGWVIASLLFQVLWGAFFCLPFGFSFTALRISTLVLSLTGVIAFYCLLRQYRLKRTVSFAGTLVLAANPLYLSLSYTYMTDVPALVMMLLAALFYLRGLRDDHTGWIILGAVSSLAAFLIRQTTLVMPVAFGLWVLLKYRGINRPIRKLLAIAVIPAAGTVCYLLWSQFVHGVPPASNVRHFASPATALSLAPGRTFRLLLYLGLFLLPLWGTFLSRVWNRLTSVTGLTVFCLWGIPLCCGVIYLSVRSGITMPYLDNLLTDLGLGPRTLRDAFLLQQNVPFRLPPMVWSVVSGISALGVALMGTMGTLYLVEQRSRWGVLVDPLLIVGLLSLFSLLAMDCIFDRYVITLIPPAVLGVLLVTEKYRPAGAWAFLLAMCFLLFSMMGISDYMNWNRARWDAARFAVNRLHCPPENVDGGFEWGGWMNYSKFDGLPEIDRDAPVSWWWVRQPRYVVTFGPLDGYRTVSTFPYASPFSRKRQAILLLESAEAKSESQQAH